MDNVAPDPTSAQRAPRLRFVPDRRFTAAAVIGVVIAVLVALLAADSEGRLLAIVAAVLLAGLAATDVVFSPRLVVSADEVAIYSPFTRARLAWSDIEVLRVVSRMRLGVRTSVLEVDAGPVLAEFSRRALGADPDDALARILAFRPGRAR